MSPGLRPFPWQISLEVCDRSNVAQNVTICTCYGSRQGVAGGRDLILMVAEPMPFQGQYVGLKRIGQQAIGAGIQICLMYCQDFIRMGQVPQFATFVSPESGALQFGPHCPVHKQDAARVKSIKEARHAEITPRICRAVPHWLAPTGADT